MSKYVVVGAGILGASTAYHLAKAGHDVTIIDRFDTGQATDAAAGIVSPWLSQRRNKDWYYLVQNGARYYPTYIHELHELGESTTGYDQVGTLALHKDERSLTKMYDRVLKKKELAPEIGELTMITSAEAIQDYFPHLSNYDYALHVSGGAKVDGRAIRNATLKAAEKLGATCLFKEATFSDKLYVDGEELGYDTLIVTTGAWGNECCLGIQPLVTHQKAQIIHLKAKEPFKQQPPVIMPPGTQYFVPNIDGTVVIGSTHEDTSEFHPYPTAHGVSSILDQAFSHGEAMKLFAVQEVRVGFRPFTANFLPSFGYIPQANNILFANGLGASGLTVGPYLGSVLSEMAQGNELDFDVNRYQLAVHN
ncbi:LOW QUALITY PROTEIN: D-amino acid dehydrogenase small subunit [Geomicrobium sp. JCM 19038]|nr:LOW QUALITY PROTEIN: D-amino acid dehydrogenase small subunit [Geomicrobium sp. JCM 19038]